MTNSCVFSLNANRMLVISTDCPVCCSITFHYHYNPNLFKSTFNSYFPLPSVQTASRRNPLPRVPHHLVKINKKIDIQFPFLFLFQSLCLVVLKHEFLIQWKKMIKWCERSHWNTLIGKRAKSTYVIRIKCLIWNSKNYQKTNDIKKVGEFNGPNWV